MGLANTTAHQAPLVWRAPEGPEGSEEPQDPAAVPGGGGAWPQHPESDGDNYPGKSRT